MISRDYTRELGLEPAERRLSLPATIAVFAVIALVGAVIVRELYPAQSVAEAVPAPAQVSSR